MTDGKKERERQRERQRERETERETERERDRERERERERGGDERDSKFQIITISFYNSSRHKLLQTHAHAHARTLLYTCMYLCTQSIHTRYRLILLIILTRSGLFAVRIKKT